MNTRIRNNTNKAVSWSSVLFVYFSLKPLYLFGSGGLQICDFFLIGALIWYMLYNRGVIRIDRQQQQIVAFMAFIVFYQICVDAVWYFVTDDISMLLNASYYSFNFITMAAVLIFSGHTEKVELERAVTKGSFNSLILTCVGLLIYSGSKTRNAGFFNNPNQLGYYATIIIAIVAMYSKHLKKWQVVISIFAALWAIIVSASKAAFLGVVGFVLLYTLFGKEKNSVKTLFWKVVMLSIFATVMYLFFFSENTLITRNTAIVFMRNRVLNMSAESDSGIGSGRGYDRIGEMGVHILWGMGEGAFDRFSVMRGSEVHSTYANIFVSYGLIGSVAYLCFMFKALAGRKKTIKNMTYISGCLLYSLTHNGIRNTLLWIFVALLIIENLDDNYIVEVSVS